MTFNRHCITCGATFPAARNCRYCPKCKRIRLLALGQQSRQRHRDGTARELGGFELCIICGKSYILEAPMQKYCGPECAQIGLKRYYLARYPRKKQLTSGADGIII